MDAEAGVAVVGWVLCLLPCSVGHLTNQPQEIWTMGRWAASSHVSFHCQSDSHVSIPPLIPVVTGASEGIGRGYALEVSMTSLCVAVSSVTHDLRVASFPAGQTRAECGHHESLSRQTAESGQRDQ